jgi:hypothetical protein
MAVIISDSANAKYGTAVATVAIANAGTGYAALDVLTINSGDTNATVTVSSVDGVGAITGITRTTVGSGYAAGTHGVTGGTGSAATITVTVQAGLGTANGFRRVEAYNLTSTHATTLSLATTRYIPVTFANAGNCQGLVLWLHSGNFVSREIKVALQENTGSWVERASVTLGAADLIGTKLSPVVGTTVVYPQPIKPFVFSTPYAVDTTASKWRFEISHGAGSGTWNLRTSDGTNPAFATWCDNQLSFTNDDVLIVKDKTIIDGSASFGAVLGTGETTIGVACVICANIADPTVDNVALLEWENPPLSAYTLTVKGKIVLGMFSGFRVGTSTNRIPVAQQATIDFTTAAAGTANPAFQSISISGSYSYGMSSLFLYGEIPTHQKTFLTADAAVTDTVLNVSDSVDWVSGDKVVVGKKDVKGQGDVTIYTVSSVSGTQITLSSGILTITHSAGLSAPYSVLVIDE